VCNTGRSASKLLATRLINNLPNIHIVSMNSLFNIQNDPSILDNVDFIISTIPIPNIEKPHIVISPLLQKGELERVRESIWLSKNEKLPAASVDKAATTLVEPYLRYQDADQFLKGGFENALPYQTMTLLGEASMDLFDLISRLYPKGIPANKYSNVSGIFAHVLMSVPRWQRGEFIEPFDYENLSEQYPEECRIISEYLDTQSKKFSVFIPEAEMIAILRYYIY
ncbi:MAG: PRD domain-containing protein, partial [Erysipelotrichaceae bacterium]|nr:PRD domain-containing protein [Erysipelotrichaceae bacterium]